MTESNKESEALGTILGYALGVFLLALSFNYEVYTILGKDVSFGLDLLAGLMIILFKFGEYKVGAYINLTLLFICVIGREILQYPIPFIR